MAASNCDKIELRGLALACVCACVRVFSSKSVHHRMRQMFATEINHFILIGLVLLFIHTHIHTRTHGFLVHVKMQQQKIRRVMCNSFEPAKVAGKTKIIGFLTEQLRHLRDSLSASVYVCLCAVSCERWKAVYVAKRQKRSD